MGKFSVCFYSFCFALKRLFFSPITCDNNIFVFIYKAFIKDIPPHHASEKERESVNDVWSDDESAEKADRGERFVEFDREERRYLFQTYSSEIEWDRS